MRGVQDQRQGAVCGVRDLHQGSVQLLHDGVARMEQDEPHFLLSEKLLSEVQMKVKSSSRDLTLSEKVILHKDSAFLGLNFEDELAVRSLPVEVKMPQPVDWAAQHVQGLRHLLQFG